jgi:hypothetical protein
MLHFMKILPLATGYRFQFFRPVTLEGLFSDLQSDSWCTSSKETTIKTLKNNQKCVKDSLFQEQYLSYVCQLAQVQKYFSPAS